MTYRCFHCKQEFSEDLAAQHFGGYPFEDPLCVQYVRSGSGGGPHDGWIRLRRDEWEKFHALKFALQMFLDRMNKWGQWDETCFYYNGRSASELQEPILKASEALGAGACTHTQEGARASN